MGYDTRKKEYFAVGVDTMGSYSVNPHGSYDPKTKSFALTGEELMEPEMGHGTFKYTLYFRVESRDRYVVEMFFEFPGQGPTKIVEVVHARRS